MYIGHLISPVPSGIFMDKFGRKQACLYLSVLPLVSWCLIWLTSSITYLYMARFVAGLWAGATSTIVPIYIGEIAEPQLRSSLSVFNHMMRNFGVLVVYIVGPLVSYRALAISCTILTIIYIISFAFMPESPYYLIMTNRNKEAFNNLKWLRGGREDRLIDKELTQIKCSIRTQMQRKGSFADVWYNKGNRKAFIISEVYSVSKRFTGAGVLQAYVSITLPPLTFGILSPNNCVIILGLVSLMSSAASVFLSIHVKRRALISFSSTGCAVTMALVTVWFYYSTSTYINVNNYSDWLFVCFIVYNATFSLGLGPIGTSVKGELFPANVKAICSSLTTVVVAITSFILNKFFLVIAENFGMEANFLIYTISCVFVTLFTISYMPETQGKSLEDIQKILQGVEETQLKERK